MASAESPNADTGTARRPHLGPAARLIEQVKGHAGTLADQGLARVGDLAESKKEEAAQKLDGVVEIVRGFANAAEGQFGGVVTGTVNRGGDALESAVQALRDHDVVDIVDGTRNAVARHPALAIGAVSIAGFLAGRIIKGGLGTRNGSPGVNRARQNTEKAA